MRGRRDGSANVGLVNWPTQLENSGEGGVYVYAVVAMDDEDSFPTCVVTHASLWVDTLIDSNPQAGEIDAKGDQRWPLEERWFPQEEGAEEWERLLSRPLYAAVLLGSSGGSWVSEEGNHWTCARKDLQEDGEKLVVGLEKLYGQKVELLTFLDT
jgi:hypothetical protein